MSENEYVRLYSANQTEVLAAEEMRVLSLCKNVLMDTVEVRSSTGRLFHVTGPDTAKSRRPIVVLVLHIPRIKTDCGSHAFSSAASQIWNPTPTAVRVSPSLTPSNVTSKLTTLPWG